MKEILIFVIPFFIFLPENDSTMENVIPKTVSNEIKDTSHHEVLEVVKAWNEAFSKNDPATYFRFIHEDLTVFVPSGPYRCFGINDDREEFEWSLKQGRTRVNFFQEIDPVVQVYDNTAIVTYYTRGIYGPEGNEPMTYLKETNVLVKENGKWEIVHIHVSR